MTTYTMIGTIVEIGEVSVFGRDNDRRRRRFSIADQDSPNQKFPSIVSFDIEDDNCALLDGFPNKARVEVSFTIQGVRYKGKDGEWKKFNKILATNVRRAEEAPYASPQRHAAPAPADPSTAPAYQRERPAVEPVQRPGGARANWVGGPAVTSSDASEEMPF